MKKLVFIFFILFILVIATGCNARRNTVHFDPKIDEISDSADMDSNESDTTVSDAKADKGPDFAINTPDLEGGKLDTNINYHLIKGSTPKNTSTITINDYRLLKYYPGQIKWSYIASTTIGSLSEGENQYAVRAFDEDGNVIGSQDFTITYETTEIPALPYVGLNSWVIFIFSLLISSLFFGFKRLRKVFIKK